MRLAGHVSVLLLLACSGPLATPEPEAWGGSSGVPGGAGAGAPIAGSAPGGGDTAFGGAGGGRPATVAGSGGQAPTAGSGGGAGTPSEGVPLDPALLAKCSGTKPIVCQLEAPNGNYDVTVALGADDVPGSSRAEAEVRHAFAPEAATAASEERRVHMTVNVRAEQHDGGQSAPANILDLTIDGAVPKLRGLGFRAAPSSITIFVAGDSTVCDWSGTNESAVSDDETGWAQALAQYLRPGVAVANYADSGETAGSFYVRFFPAARSAMKAGDYLFIQFGHNDQKDAADVAAYETNVMRYVSDAREKQVTPVLFTPVARKNSSEFAGIDAQLRELAAVEDLALIDLTQLSSAHYATVADRNALFVDGTHLSSQGANEVANLVAQALKASDLPLKSFVE